MALPFPPRTIKWILIYAALLHNVFLSAQDFPTIDSIYLPEVRSVVLYPEGLITGYPIVDLGRNRLRLEFDDLTGQYAEYSYSFYHCDRHWNITTTIPEIEYRVGFSEEEIFNYYLSIGSEVQYNHYELTVPNQQMEWKISGNYILAVWKDDGEKRLAFTRRFFVVDPILDIGVDVRRTIDQSLYRTHQEIDFFAEYTQLSVRNPFKEVSAQIYQNANWNKGYIDIPPIDVNLRRIEFDYQNQIVFPALKEFRYFDIRNLRFRTERVFEIYNEDDTINVILTTDRPRGENYFFYYDINGKFVLQNLDAIRNYNQVQSNDVDVATIMREDEKSIDQRMDLMSKYVKVHFSLDRKPIPDKDIYIVGGFNNWKIDDTYRLRYSEEDQVYFNELLLKQGYYEYMYVTKEITTGELSWIDLEGSRFETVNDYLIFIYYRPFGTLYDQLIGMFTFEYKEEERTKHNE